MPTDRCTASVVRNGCRITPSNACPGQRERLRAHRREQHGWRRDIRALREPERGKRPERAVVRNGLPRPESAEDVGGVAQRLEGRRGHPVRLPSPRCRTAEPEGEPLVGQRLQGLAHRREHHRVPKTGVRDPGGDADAPRDLTDRPASAGRSLVSYRSLIHAVPNPRSSATLACWSPGRGSGTPPGST